LTDLDAITESAWKALSERDQAREKMLPLCRDAIRFSGNAIRAVHRREFAAAEELLQKARQLLKEAEKSISGCAELAGTGIVRDAQKELTEAHATLALVMKRPLPTPEELAVDAAAYLNGLGEAVGEIRRYLLDAMRRGDLSRGEELLGAMDDIYSMLIAMDFPDAITCGLRRTTDMVRGVLERTRSDLTLTMRLKALEIGLAVPMQEGMARPGADEAGLALQDIPAGPPEDAELDNVERELYEALLRWREKKANEEGLAPFIIARNSWLKEVIKRHPTLIDELNAIKGFGERRVNKYGKDIIAIINSGKNTAGN
jgi:translin